MLLWLVCWVFWPGPAGLIPKSRPHLQLLLHLLPHLQLLLHLLRRMHLLLRTTVTERRMQRSVSPYSFPVQ